MIQGMEQLPFLREDEKTEAPYFGGKVEVYKIMKAAGKRRTAVHQIPQHNSSGTW